MGPDLYRVIKPNGWLIWFLGISWYERVKISFRAAGFTVDEIPIIWDRSDGRAFTTRPDRYFGRSYDIALHCIKGNPEVVQRSKPNIIKVPPISNEERELVVERPVELYAELIRRLTVEGETVADFFTGSGSCLAAAASLKRKYFGVELDQERRAVAIQKVKAYTP
jgi:site-specific DNA-methyltransferase (adenine-specific)